MGNIQKTAQVKYIKRHHFVGINNDSHPFLESYKEFRDVVSTDTTSLVDGLYMGSVVVLITDKRFIVRHNNNTFRQNHGKSVETVRVYTNKNRSIISINNDLYKLTVANNKFVNINKIISIDEHITGIAILDDGTHVIMGDTILGVGKEDNGTVYNKRFNYDAGDMLIPGENNQFMVINGDTLNTYRATGILFKESSIVLPHKVLGFDRTNDGLYLTDGKVITLYDGSSFKCIHEFDTTTIPVAVDAGVINGKLVYFHDVEGNVERMIL